MEINKLSNERIRELVEMGEIGAGELTDSGICPTCFNEENNYVLFGDDRPRMIYEDELFRCFFVNNPRAEGHTIIITKTHYKDMMDIPEDICSKIFVLSRRIMQALKDIYKSESVYLCTMCDGPMNHFHIQLIPRYKNEKRGSINFVKPRFDYVEDIDKIKQLRRILDYKNE